LEKNSITLFSRDHGDRCNQKKGWVTVKRANGKEDWLCKGLGGGVGETVGMFSSEIHRGGWKYKHDAGFRSVLQKGSKGE